MSDEATDEREDDEPHGNAIPRQPRCSGAESDRRVGEMIAMMRQGRGTTRELIAHAAEAWGISTRMAQEYIAKARAELREDMEADVGDARAELSGWFRECYRRAIEDGDRQAAIAAARELGKLLGLYPAKSAGGTGADPVDALRDLLAVAAGQTQRPEETPDGAA